MNLRKIIFVCAFIVLCSLYASAQKGEFEVGINFGYGFGTAPMSLSTDVGNTVKVIPTSFGSGANLGLGFGYMISDNIGVGLDLLQLVGSPYSYDNIYTSSGYYGSTTTVTTTVMTGSFFSISPSIIFSANSYGINPYGKFGLLVGIPSLNISQTETGDNSSSGTNKDVLNGGIGLGIYGAIGLQFPLAKNLVFNVELFDRAMSYAPTTLTNTQAYDGAKKENSITFVDSYDSKNPATYTQLKEYLPFSSAGFLVGIAFRFGAE